MDRYLFYAAYGYLGVMATLHFVIDVVLHHLRGKQEPRLYYGLHTAWSLGQLVFALLGIFLAVRSIDLLREAPVLALSIAAALGWIAIALLFNEYPIPKVHAGIYGVLIVAAAVTARMQP